MIIPKRFIAQASGLALCSLFSSFQLTQASIYEVIKEAVATPVAPADFAGKTILSNDMVELHVNVAGQTLAELTFFDKLNGLSYNLGPEVFSIGMEGSNADSNNRLSARSLLAGTPVIEHIPADPNARRLIDRRAGQRMVIPFAWTNSGLSVIWSAELRDGQPYVRITMSVRAEQAPQQVRDVRVLDFEAPQALVSGSVKGAPVLAAGSRLFCGVESPLAVNKVEGKRIMAQLDRRLNLPTRVNFKVSAVLGVSNPSQIRRTFQQSYINEERARPYKTFLNYNTWYDIGYFDPYSEKQAIDTVNLYQQELVDKRGVTIDSFLFDDGWDDTATLWQFHQALPNGLTDIAKATQTAKSSPGIWFSPWGGYGQPKENRLKAAEGKGFETNDAGFALAGPKYYEHFKKMCLEMINKYGVNHFKLDGTSGVETHIPGSKFSSDFEAIINLIQELREVKPDLYVNLTTGTWASPFWFGIADSIWRGGYDHEFIGEGTKRNKWMSFRDARIYDHCVESSPLFPINSLMTHGTIYTKRARSLTTVESNDLSNEIWSGFGCGTQMQEIYITPSLLTQEEWDTLAAAAKWARSNEETLIDTRWIGGSPSKLQVYGWTSWSPKKGILTLRNPSSRPQQFTFEPASLFELPVGAPLEYTLSSPKGDKLPAEKIKAGIPTKIQLQPFEVVVFEALPIDENSPAAKADKK